MGSYTCLTCNVMFSGRELPGVKDGLDVESRAAAMQKSHYKTDWHRYNLKRKVANMPPVTAETFQEKLIAHKNQAAENSKDTSCNCEVCGKHFSSKNAFENHLQSKKHKELASSKSSSISGNGDDDSYSNNDKMAIISKQKAINKKNSSNSSTVGLSNKKRKVKDKHVEALLAKIRLNDDATSSDRHQASDDYDDDDDDDSWEDLDDENAPESVFGDCVVESSITDDEILQNALKIEQCLFCPTAFASVDDNIAHMTSAHGFFIPDIEYVVDLRGEKVGALHQCLWCNERSRLFVDVRSAQQHMVNKQHCKINYNGDAILEYADFYDYRSSYPDHETAVVDEDSSIDSVDMSLHVKDNGFELILPSGSTVGHRTLMLYYRQKLRPGRELVLVGGGSGDTPSIAKTMAHYKNHGWIGTTGAAAQQRAKDISYVNRMKSRYVTKLSVRANKLQKHFRDDNFGYH